MSFLLRQAAHCDRCSHEWLVVGASVPTHCAKCKSRKWNSSQTKQYASVALGKEDFAINPKVDAKAVIEQLRSTIAVIEAKPAASPVAEIPLCNASWWEDGNQYQCLMDRGHKSPKHGMHGMVRNVTD